MPVVNVGSNRGQIFIPTNAGVYSKVVITDDSDVDYTVLDTYGGSANDNHIIGDVSITRVVTDKIGAFDFLLSNDGGRFLNKFNGGEVVKFYVDETDATTEIFRGRIDNVKYGLNNNTGFTISIDGRDYPELIDKTITGIEAAAQSDISLAGILNEFYSDITLDRKSVV